jgi:hypothetical protein
MRDELRTWLRHTADDADRPLPVRPTELLVRARSDRRRYRIRIAGASGALAIGAAAAVIATTAVVPSGDSGSSEGGVSPAGEQDGGRSSDITVPIDLGPLDDQQTDAIMTVCGAMAGDGGGGYHVALARAYDRMDGPAGVVVVRTDDGRIMDCTARLDSLVGGQATEGIEGPEIRDLPTNIPEPDPQHPLVSFRPFFGNGHRWIPGSGSAASYFEASGVLLAADTVDRVEVRVGTPDGPEPWRVAEVRNGLVFWTAWAEPGSFDNDDDAWVTWRAYDKQGNRIDQDLLPYPPQRVDPVIPSA